MKNILKKKKIFPNKNYIKNFNKNKTQLLEEKMKLLEKNEIQEKKKNILMDLFKEFKYEIIKFRDEMQKNISKIKDGKKIYDLLKEKKKFNQYRKWCN